MYDCRAYPDEKGIETEFPDIYATWDFYHCRAYPDEKGIETVKVCDGEVVYLPELQSLSR